MRGCLACELADGTAQLPGGLIHETDSWRVEHCVGPLGVGTLIVKPKRHVVRLAELTDGEACELGPLLRRVAAAVGELTEAPQVYSCLWSHGPVHLHFVVQPELPGAIAAHRAHGPALQTAMFATGEPLDHEAAAAFAERARAWLERRASG